MRSSAVSASAEKTEMPKPAAILSDSLTNYNSRPKHARDILRIRSRVSRAIAGRPGCPCRTFQVRNKRKPMRCQATTVSSLTMTNAERQSRHIRDSEAQRRRSMEINFGRFFSER